MPGSRQSAAYVPRRHPLTGSPTDTECRLFGGPAPTVISRERTVVVQSARSRRPSIRRGAQSVATLVIDRDFLRDFAALERRIQDKVYEVFSKFEHATHTGLHLEKLNAGDERLRTVRIDQSYRGGRASARERRPVHAAKGPAPR